MADLSFDRAALTGLVTTVGGRCFAFEDESSALGISPQDTARLAKSVGFSTRHVVRRPDTTTADLCLDAAGRLLAGMGLEPQAIDGLILVTQTPDYASPSTAISLQHRLGMRTETLCFDMRLGCSGFVYGLATAFSFVQSGLERVLLCVGDVASRMVAKDDRSITPIMGDAGAAALIERKPGASFFQLYSDGSGEKALYIPNSGLRSDPEDADKGNLMLMDGAHVFNFALNRVPPLLNSILDYSRTPVDAVDYFVLHQPNKYILSNIQRRFGIGSDRMPSSTQSKYGNQNSASIPGTISGFLSSDYSSRSLTSIFAGFGVGLSWAACALTTQPMFTPPPYMFEDEAS